MILLARVLAVVFHPIFMPLISAWIVITQIPYFTFAINDVTKNVVYLILLMMIIFQVLSLSIMRRHNIISDLQLIEKSERGAPIVVVLLYYMFTYLLFKYKQSDFMLPPEIYDMILAIIMSLVCTYIISKWYKMSIHMLGVTGSLGVMVALSMKYDFTHTFNPLFWIYVLIGICGLTGASRIFTGNHTFSEVAVGGFVGFMINYLIVL
jgi:hypothetical protein